MRARLGLPLAAAMLLGARTAAAQRSSYWLIGRAAADAAQSQFYLEQERGQTGRSAPQPLPPLVPGPYGIPVAPLWMPHTKVGPMTLGDLHLVGDGRGGYHGARPGYRFDIERDGTVRFHDRPGVQVSVIEFIGFSAIFDVTDLVMRAGGRDPYASDKLAVLELTSKMRAPMSDADRRRRLDDALARLPDDLAALWRREDLPAAQRRRLIFDLWDELLDGAGPEGAAAARARDEIRRFVQRALPAGSPHAYTRDELARLNAGRRSQLEFAPYRIGNATGRHGDSEDPRGPDRRSEP